jgi:lysozyme
MLTWFRALFESSTSKMLKGVDVSSFQGTPADWTGSAGGISWAAVKITELEPDGTRYVNPDASDDWYWLKDQKKGRVAYLFGHPSVSATDTVDFFASELEPRGVHDEDAVALDLEVNDGLDAARVAAWGRSVMSQLKERFDREPLLYTFIDFATAGNCEGLGGYPLWIAAPSDPAGKPTVPAPWKTWDLHQYDISGDIDRDIARFTSLAAMYSALGRPVKTAPTPPEPDLHNLGGNVTAISVARWTNGLIAIAGLGPDKHVHVAVQDGANMGAWKKVSPTAAQGAPSLVTWDPEHGRLYYVETSGAVVELVTLDAGKTWE